jgi:nucleotide-binding universal stress UspA family protein
MRILIALDESAISRRAASEARRLFPNGEFLVVNVSRRVVPWLVTGEFGMVYPAENVLLHDDGLDEEHLTSLAEAAGINPTDVLTIVGDPAHTICQAADDHDVDVVVVGSHDKGVLRRLVDPSVAQAVVQGTYRPVLVVSGTRPTDAEGQLTANVPIGGDEDRC